MSPELNETIAVGRKGLDAVARLECRAFSGDPLAILELVSLARAATEAVHGVWFNETPANQPHYSPFDPCPYEPQQVLSLVARREALHFWCGGDGFGMFPILGYPNKSEAANRQKTMLCGIQKGPWFTGKKRQKLPPVQKLWEFIVAPAFQQIRMAAEPTGQGIETDIFALPELTKETRADWVALIVRWLIETYPRPLSDRHSALYQLATERNGKQIISRKRTRLKTWKENRPSSNKGGLSPEDDDEYKRRLSKIEAESKNPPGVSPKRIEDGLTEAFTTWFANNLP
ncbi:hypothetical protein [Synoicihabitans lomoniglobus]|uniref:Uncharacterized protein n=1 Tax=Synoicihabitans lomoniglobus TaxID=2909285 RepID=A0AAF0I3M9_9BACT|nr:hypothetical protein [Opitutaceae bacterium LMO-M01]WED66015.1 hypothetical protein PXH66_04015 [Opitutaceae bacterium LMO-M01]